MTTTESRRARFRGALLGLAAGDALGTTVEFRPPGTFRPLSGIVGGGPFGLRAGAWTDDTSMALCLGESLLECRGFDAADQLRRYVRWYRDGHWSSTGRCFDIGNATRAALERFEHDPTDPYPGDAAPQAAGNGPLMKLAPVPMAYAFDPEAAVDAAARSARTTHGAPEAIDATRVLAALLVAALEGVSREELLCGRDGVARRARPDGPLHPKIDAIVDGSYLRREPPAIRGTGYVVDALEAALWAVARSDDFPAVALAAANLGDDADTTAAIAGQLAGALAPDTIPADWTAVVHRAGEIAAMADALHDLADELAPPDTTTTGDDDA